MTVARSFTLPRFRSPARGWRTLGHLIYASPLYGLSLAGRTPKGVRGTPPDSWPGDIRAAAAILGGALVFAGRRFPLSETPWPVDTGTPAADDVLNGFGWLRDLRALGTEEARQKARALTLGWIAAHRRWSHPAWRADVLGERLVNWLTNSDFLGGEGDFRRAFLDSTSRQARHLARVAASAPRDARLFAAVKGLIYAGICLPGREADVGAGLALLDREISGQILPDGGHFQRSPMLQLEVLRHLVDTRATLAAAHVEVPPPLQMAIDRMAPMVRCLRHGDGRLPLFNDGSEGDEKDISMVLAQTGTRGKALSSAPHSGFHRLAAGPTILIADTGPPAPPGAGRGAHAGTLSFEMSVGKDRLIVNCGGRPHDDGNWGAALRATAAHSTVVVDDVNSSELLAGGGLGRHPAEVAASRREVDGNLLIECSHDGYRAPFGLIHRRLIYMAPEGGDVRGEDILTGAGGHGFALHFHLHPKVQASLVSDGAAAILKLPAGSGWHFRAAGGALRLEESVYLGDGIDVKRTHQLVVSGPLNGEGALVKWRLSRQGR